VRVESLLKGECSLTSLCRQSEEGLWAREPEQIRNTEFRFLWWGEDGLMVTKDESVFLEGREV
jgi:hypothetical protein